MLRYVAEICFLGIRIWVLYPYVLNKLKYILNVSTSNTFYKKKYFYV
jgi:hypothetical protein